MTTSKKRNKKNRISKDLKGHFILLYCFLMFSHHKRVQKLYIFHLKKEETREYWAEKNDLIN